MLGQHFEIATVPSPGIFRGPVLCLCVFLDLSNLFKSPSEFPICSLCSQQPSFKLCGGSVQGGTEPPHFLVTQASHNENEQCSEITSWPHVSPSDCLFDSR